MAEIKWAMWNCSGLLPSSSPQRKMDFLNSHETKFDIVVLIETHHKTFADISPLFHTYRNRSSVIQTEASDSDPYAGIVVLINSKFTLLEDSTLIPGRLLNFKIKCHQKVYNVTAMYGYTGKNASQEKMTQMTEYLTKYHNVTDNNIILGDFNFVENDLDRTNQSKSGKNQTDITLSKPWSDFTQRTGLSDPFRVRNPRRRAYSYIHTKDNSKSRIDRIYVNDENCNEILAYKQDTAIHCKTHKMVTFSLKEECERGPGFWKMNTSILRDRAYETLVENTVNDVLSLGLNDPIERWLVFIETIAIDTRAYCEKKKAVEMRIKKLCQKNIDILEKNPALSLNDQLHQEHEFYMTKLNDWNRKQIDGYQTRIKTQPRLEPGEPNISFYADLEKRESKKKNITHLMNTKKEIKHDTESMKNIVTDYYTKLFDTKPTDARTAQKLLRNIKKQITPQQKTNLDKVITKEELEKAIGKLQKNKTPGPDGIPAEFYQTHWVAIDDLYLDFINAVKDTAFPKQKNTSITTLFYKRKGEIYLLANYRPIALINVDVKILTKLLSMRLKFVLPTIIHESQTAVYGRQIGDSVHLVRDIIDLANENDEGAALLFLDQEKAFDRVSHTILFDALKAYGFGDYFIHWIQLLYSNAFTRVNLNGFLTREIPLKCGVRQGCPLSALLYVLIIELLALQLRANPNIVGFTIQGEKIISTHYADDAVIKITQNQCFKEVYKELKEYENATGAKINFEKSTGLWVGKWRNRTDDPFQDIDPDNTKKIKWTNKNVKYLGIYVGNDRPDLQTFDEIVPKLKKRLHFWKPLELPLLSKARVIEIFHASKFFYASSFYPIPPQVEKDISEAFIDYINFPKKVEKPLVSKMEMEKLRVDGGLKLINISLKSLTPKVHWLIRLITDETLKVHLHLFNSLIGIQKGQLRGQDIIFAENSYVTRTLNTKNSFYKEALDGITKMNICKHYSNINDENVFFNPIFTTTVENEVHEYTIKPFEGNGVLSKIRTYGELLAAENTIQNRRQKAAVRKKINLIHNIRPSEDLNGIYATKGGKKYTFKPSYKHTTQNFIYAELIQLQSGDHEYQVKWVRVGEGELPACINWDKVWEAIHVLFHTEEVKSTIWEQIHLHFYTTYNYNVWKKEMKPCPLCNKIPDDIYHIIKECKFTKTVWKRIEKVLLKITPIPVTDSEKALGLQPRRKKETNATILRNWVTFFLRHQIMLEERKAFKIADYHLQSMEKFFKKFNFKAHEELKIKKLQYDHRKLPEKFLNIATINNAIATVNDGEFACLDIM